LRVARGVVKQSDIVRVSRTLHGYDDIKDIVKRALKVFRCDALCETADYKVVTITYL